MGLAFSMVKMAKGRLWHSTMEETQYLIKKPSAEVRQEKKRGVEFRKHKIVKAAWERHLAMLRQNHMAGCLACQHGTANNPQTRWRRKATGAPLPDRHRQLTTEPTPPLPGTPPVPWIQPAPPTNDAGAQCSEILNLLAGHWYSHTSLPCAECFTPDAFAQDSQHDADLDADMLTDKRTSTG